MKSLWMVFVVVSFSCGTFGALRAGEEIVGQRIYPKTNFVPIQRGSTVIANSSDLVYPVRVREVQGDWLQVWIGNRVVSTGWIARTNVCTADEAVAYFTNAIALNQNVPHALHMRSLVYMDLGQHAEAIQDATVLASRWPTAAHFTVLGNRLESGGRPEDALLQFNQALAIRPNDFWARHSRTDLLMKLNRWDEALTDANWSVAYHPRHSSGLLQRARIWKHQGQFSNAAADYEAALRINPENPDLSNQLAWLRSTCPDDSVRNGQQAMVLAKNACGLAKTTKSDCLETLAAAQAENGQFAEALESLKQARELRPQHAVVRRDRMQAQFDKNEPYRDIPAPVPPVAAPVPQPELIE